MPLSRPRIAILCALSLASGACASRSSGATSADSGSKKAARSAPALPSEVAISATGGDPNGAAVIPQKDAFGARLAALEQAERARFAPLPTPPDTAHPLVCDLLAYRGALYVSHAVQPLDRTGARIHRLRPAENPQQPLSPRWQTGAWDLVLDWNRGGRPDDPYARGGEGFTRLRVLDGTIFVPDADSPGPESFGVTDAWVENLVLRSLPDGSFPPLADRPAGALVQPWSYHAFDIIEYHGRWVVTGGVVNPRPDIGGRYPAGLWVAEPGAEALSLRHVFGGRYGVVRSTFLHRFAGRLFIGMQNNQRKLPYDLAVVSRDPAADDTEVELLALNGRRGYVTRSMVSTESTLYWLGERYKRGPSAMWRTRDGQRFTRVALPEDSGAVQDLVIAPSGARYLLTRRGLYRSRAASETFELLAAAPAGDPFGKYNSLCGARLIAVGDALIAGSLRDGRLYQVVPDPPQP